MMPYFGSRLKEILNVPTGKERVLARLDKNLFERPVGKSI